MEIFTIDNRQLKFSITNDDNQLLVILNNKCFPRDDSYYLTFSMNYARKYVTSLKDYVNGWNIYNVDKEFKRQGVDIVNIYIKIATIIDNFRY